jgi:hypothetical protein
MKAEGVTTAATLLVHLEPCFDFLFFESKSEEERISLLELFHASDFDSTRKNGIHGCFAMNSQMLRIGELVGVAGRQSFHLPHSSITWIKSQSSGMSVSTQRPGQLFQQ